MKALELKFSWERAGAYVLASSILLYGFVAHLRGITRMESFILLIPVILPTPILFLRFTEKITEKHRRVFPKDTAENKVMMTIYTVTVLLHLTLFYYQYISWDPHFPREVPLWAFHIEPYVRFVTTGPVTLDLLSELLNISNSPYIPTPSPLTAGVKSILGGVLVWVWIRLLSRVSVLVLEGYSGLVNGRWKHAAVFVLVVGTIAGMTGLYVFSPTYASGVKTAELKDTSPPKSLSDGSVEAWLEEYAENDTHNRLVNEYGLDKNDTATTRLTGTYASCHDPEVVSESSDGKYVSISCLGSVNSTDRWGLLRSELLIQPMGEQFYFVNRSSVRRIKHPTYENRTLSPSMDIQDEKIRNEEIRNLDTVFNSDSSLNLTGSTLTNVSLHTDLFVNLRGSRLHNVSIEHKNLRLVEFDRSEVIESSINETGDGVGIVNPIRGVSVRNSSFIGASREFGEIKNSSFRRFRCIRCGLRRVIFSNVSISNSVFVNSNLEKVNFINSTVSDSAFNRSVTREITVRNTDVANVTDIEDSVN